MAENSGGDSVAPAPQVPTTRDDGHSSINEGDCDQTEFQTYSQLRYYYKNGKFNAMSLQVFLIVLVIFWIAIFTWMVVSFYTPVSGDAFRYMNLAFGVFFCLLFCHYFLLLV